MDFGDDSDHFLEKLLCTVRTSFELADKLANLMGSLHCRGYTSASTCERQIMAAGALVGAAERSSAREAQGNAEYARKISWYSKGRLNPAVWE